MERFSRRGARQRRQSYDIAILNPADVSSGTLDDATEGRFDAPIAVELGLDYSLAHLRGDLDKFARNKVAHPYVVHLTRKRTRHAEEVERTLLEPGPVRTAFAHLDSDTGRFRLKRLADPEIRDQRYRG